MKSRRALTNAAVTSKKTKPPRSKHEKTIRKLEYTVQLLRLRYSVVLSDLDIVFFQNPIDYLKRYKPHAHIAVQRDFWPGNLKHILNVFVNFSETF